MSAPGIDMGPAAGPITSGPAVPLPPTDILTGIGAALTNGLNRWMDVEVYRRTGGALLPGGQVSPGAWPAASPLPAPTPPAYTAQPWLLLAAGAVVLVLLVRK
jgi:hypothetical protein